MQIKNSMSSYGMVTIALHWISAIMVVSLFALGLWMDSLSYYSKWYRTAPDLHRSFGVILTLIILFRLFWRLRNPSPTAPSNHKAWEIKGAHLAHWCLYILLLAMFPTGYLITTAKGSPLEVFGIVSIPATVTGVANLEDIAGEVHEIIAYTLIGIASVHALAAIKHHLIDKDNTLRRMLGLRLREPE